MVVCIIRVYRAQHPRIRNTCKCTPSGNKYTHTFTCINVSLCLHEPPDIRCCHWVVFACFVVVCLFVLYSCVRLYFAFPMGNRSIMASWKILVFPQRKASCEIEIFSNVIVLPSLINLYRVGGTAAQLCQDKASPPPLHAAGDS